MASEVIYLDLLQFALKSVNLLNKYNAINTMDSWGLPSNDFIITNKPNQFKSTSTLYWTVQKCKNLPVIWQFSNNINENTISMVKFVMGMMVVSFNNITVSIYEPLSAEIIINDAVYDKAYIINTFSIADPESINKIGTELRESLNRINKLH